MKSEATHERLEAGQAGGVHWYCPDQGCSAATWLVDREPGAADVWLVAEADTAHPWRVAAARPICPWCAADLICLSLT